MNIFENRLVEIKNIKNKHLAEEFVVVGGGPSIEKLPGNHALFDGKITIACNFKKVDFKAHYHLLHDPLSIMWWQKNNVDLLNSDLIFADICKHYKLFNTEKNPDKMKIALNSTHIRDRWLGDVPVVEYLQQISYLAGEKRNFYYVDSPFYKFNENFHVPRSDNRICEKWYGSGFLAIDLAVFLGAKKIYLVGFDGGQHHSYENNPSHRHYTMKNRNITHWQQHRERLKQLSKEINFVLVNPQYSIYNGLVDGVKYDKT